MSTREAAENYVMSLFCNPAAYNQLFSSNYVAAYDSNNLQTSPSLNNQLFHALFMDYARNWWIWDKCKYVICRRASGTKNKPGIKPTTVKKARQWTTRYLIPYFGHMELGQITTDNVNTFILKLLTKHALSPKTINNIRSVLSVMMEQAKLNRIIPYNPVSNSICMKVEKKETELLTDEECEKLFDLNRISEIWSGSLCHYVINYISGLTGMRIGELLALTINDISEEEIRVSKNYSREFGIGTTKNSESRRVPITKEMYLLLYVAYHENRHSSDYIFCINGDEPMSAENCRRSLYRAMERIGISEDERKRRNLTFHSWRHKFNTDCVKANMHPAKIRAITGHKSESMLYSYTDLTTADLAGQVNEIQKRRLPPLTNKKK